ncbi:MAG: glycosyltransferase family 4 protein [Nitrospirota bacterium]
MNNLNILMVNNFFYPRGGAEISLFNTAQLLKEKGHKVFFFSSHHPENYEYEYSQYFVRDIDFQGLSSVKAKIAGLGRAIWCKESQKKLEWFLKEHKIDIAHLNNINYRISPSIISVLKGKKIPIVMHLRDYYLVCGNSLLLANGKICEACRGGKYFNAIKVGCRDGLKGSGVIALSGFLHHKVLKIFDKVNYFISPSRFLIKEIEEMGFDFKERVVYLPNFVDTSRIEPEFSFEKKNIIYIGRLSLEKGLETLLEAVKGLEINLEIAGEGPLKNRLEEKVKKEKISNIKFLGYLSDEKLANKIKEGMASVVPSEWYENNPRSVLESFAYGKPVIGSNVGGIPELVRHGETGLLFEMGNAQDLRARITEMLQNPSKITEMGQKARKIVEDEYNQEIYYQRLKEVYEMACS